jgi:hypothetical protein
MKELICLVLSVIATARINDDKKQVKIEVTIRYNKIYKQQEVKKQQSMQSHKVLKSVKQNPQKLLDSRYKRFQQYTKKFESKLQTKYSADFKSQGSNTK